MISASLVQLDVRSLAPAENFRRIHDFVAAEAGQGAQHALNGRGQLRFAHGGVERVVRARRVVGRGRILEMGGVCQSVRCKSAR